MIEAGAACIDITPPPGLQLCGFAARSLPAIAAHDALTARAVAVNDTALLIADVIGIDAAMSLRIRQRCVLPTETVVVAALHTHGGPVSMSGRLGNATDPAYLERLEDACVQAINKAAAGRRPARLAVGSGKDPQIARNRRHAGGLVDSALPVLSIIDEHGAMIAILTAYACHPVVLAADNRLWTADYPHFVRHALEQAHPGAIALFMTGCAGDANTGHSAQASISLASGADRSFAAAQRIGRHIADMALAADMHEVSGGISADNLDVVLGFKRRETLSNRDLVVRWQTELETADPARQRLLGYWIAWANTMSESSNTPIYARVTVLGWAGVPIVALPGEIFAQTALAIRQALPQDRPGFVIGFADDNPGYIPPADEFAFGGYEVDEAHRYYGQPSTFAPGSAEKLEDAARTLLRSTAI